MTAYDTRRLQVGDGHSLYIEQSGDPGGVPAVFLHGGPGSGCQAGQRRLFDGKRFRVILFDQRGAGRSTPKRSLEHNTTQHLVADLEQLREALGIERWMLVGGSWGALLAIAYAEAHPERVSAIALRALFLGSAAEIDWAFIEGPRMFRPELWRAFVGLLPTEERSDPLAAYGRRLADPGAAVHGPAAWAWHDYERALSELQPATPRLPESLSQPPKSNSLPNTPFFEAHYIRRGFFLEPEQLLTEAVRLAGIPGIIVQGRYDLLCPPVTAQRLAARWPDAQLRIIEGAGHAVTEPGIAPALKSAIAELGGIVGR
ncbi:MAG: prolyl aminopeptidase [Kiloniellales bacterium]